MAVDPCDAENGCLEVVPGSHAWPILCTIGADTSQSFTDSTVPLPDDGELVLVVVAPGDVRRRRAVARSGRIGTAGQ